MNYEIVPLNGQGVYDLNGVRFNNRQNTFTYWKNRSTANNDVRGIMVVFDDKYVNRKISDGVMMLSLKGLKSPNELIMALRVFVDIMEKQGLNVVFYFVVSNDNQRQVAEMIAREVGIKYEINVANEQKDVREEQKGKESINKLEDELKKDKENKDVNVYGSKTIETNNNGINKKITISGDKAYENIGNISIDERKFLLLQEWKKDPSKSAMLAGKSSEEIDRMLLDVITLGKKEYDMTSSMDQTAVDEVSRVAMKKASQEDGKVNSELGIVKNGVYNNNLYSAVEKDGNSIKMVNTSVTNATINSGGVISNSSSRSEDNNYNESNMLQGKEKSREVFDENKIYYMDDEYNIIKIENDQEILVGKVGYDGYDYDVSANIITKDGKPQAYVGNIRDLEHENSNKQSKPKVRTLQKEDNQDKNDENRGFATLPVILFIISFLLLVGSGILLFILK